MPNKITKITPAQAARFGEWAQKWIEVGLSTAPADFDRATAAALRGYELANLKRPMVILHMSSPYGATLGGALAWAMLREVPNIKSQVENQVWSQVENQVWNQVGSQVWNQVENQVRSQVRSQVENQVRSQVRSQVENQVWSQVENQVRSQVENQVWSQVENQVWSQVRSQVENQVWSQVRNQVWNQVENQVKSQVRSQACNNSYHGNFWAAWGAYVSFMRDVLDWTDPILERFEIDEELIKNCGWVWWHKNVLAISDRPRCLNRDEVGRLHCVTGPSIAYRDNWSLWHVHGVAVPQFVIEAPQEITIKKIDGESNTEIRRVMIDRYKVGQDVAGPAAYLRDAGGKRLDHDESFGTLWRREIKDDEPIVMAEVVNRSPEIDGQFRRYFIRVPPTMTKIHEAVAWSFGKTPDEYKPTIET